MILKKGVMKCYLGVNHIVGLNDNIIHFNEKGGQQLGNVESQIQSAVWKKPPPDAVCGAQKRGTAKVLEEPVTEKESPKGGLKRTDGD
jgi:hypothetical protein